MRTRQWTWAGLGMWAGLAAASALWPAIAAAGEIANYSPVTADRLTNPEAGKAGRPEFLRYDANADRRSWREMADLMADVFA